MDHMDHDETMSDAESKTGLMTDKETISELLSKVERLELQLHNTRRPALPDVEKYDGKSAFQLKSFMAELKNKHAQDGEVLGGDKGFVHYAYSRLTGKARNRVSPYIETYLTMKDGKKALKAFYTLLEDTFSDPSAVRRAIQRATTLSMGQRAVLDYIAEAELIFLEANGSSWPDNVKISYVEQGLSAELADRMVSTKEYTFVEYKKEICCW
ncbi:hypothetical protein CFO_g5491 [Ceratocystis platani]|uniref:Retrotransposon gag protein n=1 Tax=Ceratocystis fimbriata f. sp. platani TaxID=88771 RepID=A0A0F8AWB1_CERFI|nr:hypothetical protein CFO_g5491 [Ceratocystis platani]